MHSPESSNWPPLGEVHHGRAGHTTTPKHDCRGGTAPIAAGVHQHLTPSSLHRTSTHKCSGVLHHTHGMPSHASIQSNRPCQPHRHTCGALCCSQPWACHSATGGQSSGYSTTLPAHPTHISHMWKSAAHRRAIQTRQQHRCGLACHIGVCVPHHQEWAHHSHAWWQGGIEPLQPRLRHLWRP